MRKKKMLTKIPFSELEKALLLTIYCLTDTMLYIYDEYEPFDLQNPSNSDLAGSVKSLRDLEAYLRNKIDTL